MNQLSSQFEFPSASTEPRRPRLNLVNFLPILLLAFVVMLGVILFRQQRELNSREHELLVLKNSLPHDNEGDGSMPDF